MSALSPAARNRRILVVDDNSAIHADFAKVLARTGGGTQDALAALEAQLFGDAPLPSRTAEGFDLSFASQGEEGFAMVREAARLGEPFAMAFVDVRMPPGWDGLRTAAAMWEVDPSLQIVICTAYSDHSWEQMLDRLGTPERYLILKKPFDTLEVKQLAHALTQKWELAREVRLRVDGLERTVEERTREVETMQADLRRAQRLEALGVVVGGVAHEINNPLAFILSNLSFVTHMLGEGTELTTDLREEVLRAIADSIEGGHRIQRIVSDLRTFARERTEEPLEPVDVVAMLEDCLRVARPRLESVGGLQLELADLPRAKGNGGRLAQVFAHILGNAASAVAATGRTREQNRVRLSAGMGPHGRIVVEVEDNGPGIRPEHLERLFDPFFTTRPFGQGTGLGLAVCHGIVRSMGGRITVQSEVDRGSVFRVELPVQEAEGQPSPGAVRGPVLASPCNAA